MNKYLFFFCFLLQSCINLKSYEHNSNTFTELPNNEYQISNHTGYPISNGHYRKLGFNFNLLNSKIQEKKIICFSIEPLSESNKNDTCIIVLKNHFSTEEFGSTIFVLLFDSTKRDSFEFYEPLSRNINLIKILKKKINKNVTIAIASKNLNLSIRAVSKKFSVKIADTILINYFHPPLFFQYKYFKNEIVRLNGWKRIKHS